MKIKLVAIIFIIFSIINIQTLYAQIPPLQHCLNTTDIFVENAHECVYCPPGFTIDPAAPNLTCSAKSCLHGTDPHLHKNGLCMYCSEGYNFDTGTRTCVSEKK